MGVTSGNKELQIQIDKKLLIGSYLYLILPLLIFLLGWCKGYIGFPAAVIICISMILSIREHAFLPRKFKIIGEDKWRCVLVLALILFWVGLSGIGGYVWQNEDHTVRNAIFDILVEENWPAIRTVTIDGITQERGLIYYMGFWLPAALVGKIFGMNAGYAMQYVWAVVGVLIFYALICMWRKKILIWPLIVVIFFSGWDAVGMIVSSADTFNFLGIEHLEHWMNGYQYSSMTTQLFWVFNQALPSWVASALIFISEKPKNIVFVWMLIMLTSTFPFIGLFPYVIYFLITRVKWKENKSLVQLLKNAWENWGSFQNILGGGITGLTVFLYLSGNASGHQVSFFLSNLSSAERETSVGIVVVILLVLVVALWALGELWIRNKKKVVKEIILWIGIILGIVIGRNILINNNVWNTYVYRLLSVALFYFFEVGVFYICLYKKHNKDKLYYITGIWLLIIPFVVVGFSIDFCMRASIPALLLIMLWCIQILDEEKRKVWKWLLIACIAVGAITPLHEMKRTLVNSKAEYKLERSMREDIFTAENFSGTTGGLFWTFIAR